MSKRTFKEVRQALLSALKDGKDHSYSDLERKVDTNWKTIRDHCENLAFFGAITITRDRIKITDNGLKLLKKI